MRFDRTAALVTMIAATLTPVAAADPFPDPPPQAHGKKATITFAPYWIDLSIFVDDVLVHGAKGRCHYPKHGPRRCFIIRVGVR